MTQHWDYDYAAEAARKREALVGQVNAAVADRDALLAQRAELICEVETMRARLGAWRETARKGVRLVEHITVTQSTDGQWPAITALYEMFDELHDAEQDRSSLGENLDERYMAEQARRKVTRARLVPEVERDYPNPASSQEDQDNQTGIPR